MNQFKYDQPFELFDTGRVMTISLTTAALANVLWDESPGEDFLRIGNEELTPDEIKVRDFVIGMLHWYHEMCEATGVDDSMERVLSSGVKPFRPAVFGKKI